MIAAFISTPFFCDDRISPFRPKVNNRIQKDLPDVCVALSAHHALAAMAKRFAYHCIVYEHHKAAYADKHQHSRHKHDEHQNICKRIIDIAF